MEKESNDLFQDMPPEQRSEMLAARAVSTEQQKVKRPFTEFEKSQKKEFITAESIVIMDKVEEFKAISKEFNQVIKASRETVTDALKGVKRGYSENEELVYNIDDQDAGVMNTFDANGVCIGTRKLFPTERQSNILNMPSTGTHG
jgi:hypothetical protein